MLKLIVKILFYVQSKLRHWHVVLNHWFWVQHYRGALHMHTYKISDEPLVFKLDFKSRIDIADGVNFAGSSKLLAIDGGALSIGRGTYFNTGCSLNAMSKIEIGENCLFGEQVKIYDHNHRFNLKDELLKNQGYTLGEVNIGHNTWVGSQVVILKGVTIGDNVVIGAGCLISKNIKSNSIVHLNTDVQLCDSINYK